MWGKCGESFLSFYICRNDKKEKIYDSKILDQERGGRLKRQRQESMSASKMGEGLM